MNRNQTSEQSAWRRGGRAGFTLIELMVVIAIIVTLMSLLLPAIFRAKIVVLATMTKGQINRLTQACNGYASTFDQVYPGVVADNQVGDSPAIPLSGTPSKISGCQNVRLALLGCSRTGGSTYRAEDRGPADDIDNYLGNNQWTGNPTRIYRTFYTPDKDEVKAHGDSGCPTYGSSAGYNTSPPIRVFVSYHMPVPRPLLYYRASAPGTFNFNDNSVYCDGSQHEAVGDFSATGAVSRAQTAQSPFLIIAAGYDGIYFNADDFDSTNQ